MGFSGGIVHAETPPAPVLTVIAEKSEGVVRSLSLTGTVTARRQARLSSRATGLIMEMRVDAGSFVKKGDVLTTLDQRLAEITLEGVEVQIGRARVELEEAQRKVKEVVALVTTGGISRSEDEMLKAAAKVRDAELKQLLVRKDEQVELIARHQLIAPFTGVVSRKLAEEGEWVPTGTPVVELVDTEKPHFDLQVPQELLASVSRAEKVIVRLDAHPGSVLEARIDVMVPVKDTVSRTFLARLELDDPNQLATPGMSGTAGISFRANDEKTVQIPRDAVVRYPDGSIKVWVVSRSGESDLVRSREIKTGGSLGALTEVVEGLEGGEEVVLKGNEGLREEQVVRPIEEGQTPKLP